MTECRLLIKCVQVATLPKIFQKFPNAKWVKFELLNMAYKALHVLAFACLSDFISCHSSPCTLCFGHKLIIVPSLERTSTSILILFPSSRHLLGLFQLSGIPCYCSPSYQLLFTQTQLTNFLSSKANSN